MGIITQLYQTHIENINSKQCFLMKTVLSAVVQITAGAGGTESCDWAGMLMRMYADNGAKVMASK